MAFSILHAYEVARPQEDPHAPWAIHVEGYSHDLFGENEREVLAFHWHPDGRSPIIEPHLHIEASIARVDLRKAHVPTGTMTLQAFLGFMSRDLGVEPLRSDWRAILA